MARWRAVLVFAASAAYAQTAIEGYIKEGGKPVANAVIAIQRQDVARSYQAKTDKHGSYFQQGLPVGFYAVKVVVDGQERVGTMCNAVVDSASDAFETSSVLPQIKMNTARFVKYQAVIIVGTPSPI